MPPIRPSLICERIEAQLVAQRLQRAAQKSTGLDSPVLNFEILWEIRQARSLLGRLMLGVLVRLEFPAFNVACVQFRVVLPFFRQIIERKNCEDGTNGHTGSAIDALHRINIELRHVLETGTAPRKSYSSWGECSPRDKHRRKRYLSFRCRARQ